jgi:hypothetical protein
MRLAGYELAIGAPAEEVWRLLTTGDGLVRWVGPEASADPVPGGDLRWVHPNGATVVRLTHRGLPPGAVEDHERGWAHFLGRLRDAA